MRSGISSALLAALLFGASTPLAKQLLTDLSPFAVAGLFYLGSGLGLSGFLLVRRVKRWHRPQNNVPADVPQPVGDQRPDWPNLAGAVLAGGIAAPVLLMTGLESVTGAQASLLLNLEGVLTACIAWIVFREPVDRRVAWGMGLIVFAGILLALPTEGAAAWNHWNAGELWIALACLGWAIDNNLTRNITSLDAAGIAAIKGITAGTVNLALALHLSARLPGWQIATQAALIGFFSYGASLVLFITALRQLGTARTAAWFSAAPFAGALLSLVLLHEAPTGMFWVALILILFGLWLHFTEQHEHWHQHARMLHAHTHRHDAHHRHTHDFPWDGSEPHSHTHAHEDMAHRHAHMPDIHHQHRH